MADVAVYHNPHAMGYPATEVREPVIVTNKRVTPDSLGDRVWLLTGAGQPRRFFLRGVFTVSRIESAEDEGYRTRVWGSDARFFSPMIELTGRAWFRDLQRSQGNFAFGYQVISDSRLIRGLEAAARQRGGKTFRSGRTAAARSTAGVDDLPPNRRAWYSVTDYRRALIEAEPSISDSQRQMLAAHAAAPDLILTVDQLAAAAGYDKPQITFSQYGRLGHTLAEALSHEVEESIWTRLIGEDFRTEAGEVAWEMEPALARALIGAGWATRTTTRDILAEIDEEKESMKDVPATTRRALVQARVGQGPFRDRLVRYWGACAVTGVTTPAVLRASHIKPWRHSTNKERLSRHNGLLLAAHLDSLFDAGLISFDSDGEILISDLVPSSDRARLGLTTSMRIKHVDRHQQVFLRYHREQVLRNRDRQRVTR